MSKTTYFYVNSGTRTTGTATNFRLFTDNSGLQGVKYYTVESVTVPYTWYTIRSGQNTIELTTTIDGVLNVTIPSGNYTALTLAAAIDTQLNLVATGVFTTTYSSITQKYTISLAGDTFSITAANLSNGNLWKRAGFTAAQPAPTASKVGDIVVTVTGDNKLYVSSKLLGNRDSYDTRLGKFGPSDIIADVLVNVNSEGIVHDKKAFSTLQWREWPDKALSNIDLRLHHENANELVDLNGSDWQITILLRTDLNY